MAVLDFQQSVVVDNTEVVDKVETKKKRPFLSFFEVSADARVAKMPRMTPDITFMFYQTETSLILRVTMYRLLLFFKNITHLYESSWH